MKNLPTAKKIENANLFTRAMFVLSFALGFYVNFLLSFLILSSTPRFSNVLGVSTKDFTDYTKLKVGEAYTVMCTSDYIFNIASTFNSTRFGCKNIPFQFTFPNFFTSFYRKISPTDSLLVYCISGKLNLQRKDKVSFVMECSENEEAKETSSSDKSVASIENTVRSAPLKPHPGLNSPIIISAQSYLDLLSNVQNEGRGPFIVYVSLPKSFESEAAKLSLIKDESVTKWAMFSSFEDMRILVLEKGTYLKSLGLNALVYAVDDINTPEYEIDTFLSTTVGFITFASDQGFDSVWIPNTSLTQSTTPGDLELLRSTGLDWVSLKTDLFEEPQCLESSIAEAKNLVSTLQSLGDFKISINLSPSKCSKADKTLQNHCIKKAPDYLYSYCDAFINETVSDIDALHINTSTPQDMSNLPQFIDEIRDSIIEN